MRASAGGSLRGLVSARIQKMHKVNFCVDRLMAKAMSSSIYESIFESPQCEAFEGARGDRCFFEYPESFKQAR